METAKEQQLSLIDRVPPEWIRSLSRLEFPNFPALSDFLKQNGVKPEDLSINPVNGRPMIVNGFTPTLESMDGRIRLTDYGIGLLKEAFKGDLESVNTHFSSSNFIETPRQPWNTETITAIADFAQQTPTKNMLPLDLLKHSFEIAPRFTKVFPTAGLADFAEHFASLRDYLREGEPLTSRKPEGAFAPGELFKLYLLSLVNDPQSILSKASLTPEGSLHVSESVHCIEDEARTKKFLSAVDFAVHRLAQSVNGPIEVIDAGCGGLPIQAIQAALSNPNVHVTALELNPAAIEMAQQIIERVGLKDRITIVRADATTYQPDVKPHLIISETIQAGLTNEPIVQILKNLQPHLQPGGLTIPESIEINCGITSMSDYYACNGFIDIRTAQVPAIKPRVLKTLEYRPEAPLSVIRFDLQIGPELAELHLLSVHLQINLGNDQLKLNESLITMPRMACNPVNIRELGAMVLQPGRSSKVKIIYQPGAPEVFGYVLGS